MVSRKKKQKKTNRINAISYFMTPFEEEEEAGEADGGRRDETEMAFVCMIP